MKTLILDNYDSFTFNLYQEVGELGGNPVVERNDAITIDAVRALAPTHIIIGPGPGNPTTPRDIGISRELMDFSAEHGIPLLGVCLGHQILGVHCGATVSRAPFLCHGKASPIRVTEKSSLFTGISPEFSAMRYHSLHVEPRTVPAELRITALSDDGVIMAMEHREFPLFGVQFHPESIGTPVGKDILKNFLTFPVMVSPSARLPPSPSGFGRAGRVNSANHHSSTAEELLTIILSSDADDAERSQAFTDLVSQPITAELLSAGVRALRAQMIPVDLPGSPIDTCGTGGSGQKTINTSSLTAFIVAAAGGKVAKHGNRSASGNCGCFDLLETLGVRIDLTPEQERKLFAEFGIVFLFAPLHHPALRHVAPLRKRHGKKTLFNLLGPLCNPAGVSKQMIGTGNNSDAELIAQTLRVLNTQLLTHSSKLTAQSFVVTGHDGLDEVTVTTSTMVRRVLDSGVEMTEFSPETLSIPLVTPEEIIGGRPEENAKIFLELAQGKGSEPMKNLVLVNAAHALLLTPLVKNLKDAHALAKETLSSGRVFELFSAYRDLSQTL